MKHFIDRLFDFFDDYPAIAILVIMWVGIAVVTTWGGAK